MPTFQPNVPTGTVPLNQDYLNLQGNNQQLDIAYGRDHVPFSDTTGIVPPGISGMHKTMHMVPVSTVASNPPNNQPIDGFTATTDFGQLLSAQINDGINIDSALYFLTGGNRLQQLTRNFVPVSATNGFTFIPGGLILQWGSVSATNSNPPVVFPLAFPNAIFNVQVTRQHSSSSPGSSFSFWVDNGATLTKTGFTIINNDGHTWSYNWVAIGN